MEILKNDYDQNAPTAWLPVMEILRLRSEPQIPAMFRRDQWDDDYPQLDPKWSAQPGTP